MISGIAKNTDKSPDSLGLKLLASLQEATGLLTTKVEKAINS
jgi:hypothetical protein